MSQAQHKTTYSLTLSVVIVVVVVVMTSPSGGVYMEGQVLVTK